MGNQHPAPQSLFAIPDSPRARTSDVLIAIAKRCEEPDVTLRSLTERLGDRTFGVLLILIATFNLIPLISIIAGPLVSLLGLQMAIGRVRIWLPKTILDRQLPRAKVRSALLVFDPKVRAIERFIRPRWQFTEAPIVDRINGIVITILGLIITIPLPLTNIGPALVVILMGLGLLERDGFVQVSAATFGIIIISAIYYFVIY